MCHLVVRGAYALTAELASQYPVTEKENPEFRTT